MKKIFTVLLLLFLSFWLFSEGNQEDSRPLVLGVQFGDYEVKYSLDGEDLGEHSGVFYYKDIVFKDYPEEIEIRSYSQDNTTIKMDADLAGGDPPDIYFDYLGRVNKYANSKYAVPLDRAEYEEAFIPSYLDQLTKGGVLYGLPDTAWASIMIVNKTLVESAGAGHYLPPDTEIDRSWSISDFLSVTDAVQEKYGKEYYGYVLFASGTGGDYWSSFGWLAGAGASLYKNGKIVVDDHAGLKALNFMHSMLENGYAMPGAAGLTYAENVSAMARNNVVAKGGVPSNVETPIELSDGSGFVDTVIMEYPYFPGVEKIPVTVGPDAGMLFNTGNEERIKRAKKVLEWITSERFQSYRATTQSRFASRKGIPVEERDSFPWRIVNNMIQENGVFDSGVGLEHYSEVRELWPPTLQAIFSGELSVEAAVDRFVSEGHQILE